jgi:hypothetical protein
MDGEHLGNNRIKLGFGKSMATNCVWVDGIAGIIMVLCLGRFPVYKPMYSIMIFYKQHDGAWICCKLSYSWPVQKNFELVLIISCSSIKHSIPNFSFYMVIVIFGKQLIRATNCHYFCK